MLQIAGGIVLGFIGIVAVIVGSIVLVKGVGAVGQILASIARGFIEAIQAGVEVIKHPASAWAQIRRERAVLVALVVLGASIAGECVFLGREFFGTPLH